MTFYQSSAEFKPQSLSDWVAPDCHGLNFFEIDTSLQGLLKCYLDEDMRNHMSPHFAKLGEIAGNELDDWSRQSDKHQPKLHQRDARGRDEDWIEFHPPIGIWKKWPLNSLACMR
ncbi:hypothetical protein [Sneathiella glossodoripedis]|uniref:hypothetical protein n=1 Tax=Sneathiella glossodoripedis TaxID=418853 RepID=UPI0019010669|nr:hypothetical protein [Sneathiella glossodoripedis]